MKVTVKRRHKRSDSATWPVHFTAHVHAALTGHGTRRTVKGKYVAMLCPGGAKGRGFVARRDGRGCVWANANAPRRAIAKAVRKMAKTLDARASAFNGRTK